MCVLFPRPSNSCFFSLLHGSLLKILLDRKMVDFLLCNLFRICLNPLPNPPLFFVIWPPMEKFFTPLYLFVHLTFFDPPFHFFSTDLRNQVALQITRHVVRRHDLLSWPPSLGLASSLFSLFVNGFSPMLSGFERGLPSWWTLLPKIE